MSSEKLLREELSKAIERKNAIEIAMAASIGEIYHTVTHPSKIIKDCIKDLASDKSLHADLGKLALHAVTRGITGPQTKTGLLSRIALSLVNYFTKK
jgi:hypothetical protein